MYVAYEFDFHLLTFHVNHSSCQLNKYRVFHNVLHDYIYNKKTKGPTLMELFTATGKLKKFFFTTRDVRSVHHG